MTENTLRGAVERRRGDVSEAKKVLDETEKRITAATGWFRKVAPKHIDAEQFTGLCIGALRKGDRKLQQAVIQSPESFMQAVSECAQLGLIPGTTYHFVPFYDTESKRYQIVGIVDYKGEIDQIYRAGGVQSVHCHVVREKDTFIWRPGQMDLPHHIIHAPDDSEQEGLAGAEARGVLTGVYAYAVMASGGYSQPVIMGASTVKKHRDAARTDKFWGPEWPEEGPWTEDMWRKTAIHKLYDLVPHSAEFLAERLRAVAEAERVAVTDLTPARPARQIASGPVATVAEPEPEPEESAQPEPEPPVDKAKEMRRMHAIFRDYGLGGKDNENIRRAVITGLLDEHSIQYARLSEMTPEATQASVMALVEFCKELDARGEDVGRKLMEFGIGIASQIQRAQPGKAEPDGQ